MERRFTDAYEAGVKRLVEAIGTAVDDEPSSAGRISVGLHAGLELLAADPALAHLLLVEPLSSSRLARLEHERSLLRLADLLRSEADEGWASVPSEERARLLAAGLASSLSGWILAGEAERLPELHASLLECLLDFRLAVPGR